MNTKIYEYLLAVAEHKNISQAAQSCFISQPALTQHIKKLEHQIGSPLFERSNGQLIPTKQGEIFLITAQRMLKIEHDTMAHIRKLQLNVPVVYRIFVDIEMRNLLIEKILPKLLYVCPRLKPSLVSGDLATAWSYLDKGIVDTGIFPIHKAYPDSIDCISVEQSEYILLLPPHHPLAEQFSSDGVDIQQLSEETFILNQEFSAFYELQCEILEYSHFKPGNILHTHSIRAAVQMVLDGLGVSFLPNTIVPFLPKSCTPCSFNPPWRFRYVIAYAKQYGLSIYHTQLANILMEHYSQFHKA